MRDHHGDLPPPRDSNGWHAPPQDPPRGRWPASDSYRPGGPEIPDSRTRSPEVPLRYRPPTPPPVDEGRRFNGPLVEHPVAGLVHPDRARRLGPPPEDDRTRAEHRHHRGISSPTLGPPRGRSPPPSQNGHRPDMKRGGSLLERLTLHDGTPHGNGGSSLRDRVDGAPPRDHDEVAGGTTETMEVDGEQGDDGQRNGGRGPARRRVGKPRRSRRN
ncbi:hypothetical protein FKP32DRAFT_935690 [Trametes sanguinea]|nr:hypothetical protein FKP32DRAFT_935690 [Trametes sanguinea]